MQDLEVIHSELRLLAAVRRTVRDEGGPMPSTAPTDELLDERLAHRGRGRLADINDAIREQMPD